MKKLFLLPLYFFSSITICYGQKSTGAIDSIIFKQPLYFCEKYEFSTNNLYDLWVANAYKTFKPAIFEGNIRHSILKYGKKAKNGMMIIEFRDSLGNNIKPEKLIQILNILNK